MPREVFAQPLVFCLKIGNPLVLKFGGDVLGNGDADFLAVVPLA